MIQSIRIMIAGFATTLLSACANLNVHGPVETTDSAGKSSIKFGELRGIPFYIKVPVLTQETKIVRNELLLGVTVTLLGASGPVKATHYPPSGQLRVQDDPAIRKFIDTRFANLLQEAATKKYTFEKTQTEASQILDEIGKEATKAPKVENRTVSNSWTLGMVVGPQPYYITGKIPLIGTATSNFKFFSDGTLNEAQSTVADDTAKTVLGLFPITAKLTDQWGLTPNDAKTIQMNGKAVVSPDVRIDISIKGAKTLFTLRKLTKFAAADTWETYFKDSVKHAPLTLGDAGNGANGVQLISEEELKPEDGESGEKPDSKAYMLQGTIMPPKVQTPKPGNTDPSKGPVTQ